VFNSLSVAVLHILGLFFFFFFFPPIFSQQYIKIFCTCCVTSSGMLECLTLGPGTAATCVRSFVRKHLQNHLVSETLAEVLRNQ
jgi:hypothetical protein